MDKIYHFSAPGRTEIGGNHTDHQHGCVIAAAVDIETTAEVTLNGTNIIRVDSEGYKPVEIGLNDLSVKESEKNTTAALIRGVAAAFAQRGYKLAGFDAKVKSTVLPGSGLSSSAAFEVLIGRILYRSGNFDAYPRFADELKNLAFALAQVRKQADAKCLKYAQDYCKEPYNIWIGSGDLWPTAYSYSMCVLEESQWIRTKSVSSPEFFHGTLELLEDDVCTTLLLTEGPTRAQDERVKAFAARHTKKLTCFDTKEYALPGISDEFRPLLSPVVMAAVLQRISKNIEVITDHSLDIRRYYRKESY